MKTSGSRITPRDRTDWTDRAACSRVDPAEFDVPRLITRAIDRSDFELLLEFTLDRGRWCHRCPVAAECARDALDCADHGVLRAGVPIPAEVVHNKRLRGPIYDCLERIAAGMTVAQVWRRFPIYLRAARRTSTGSGVSRG